MLDDTGARGRAVIQREGDFVGPLFFSFGDLDLLCGACGFVLIRGVRSNFRGW